MKRIAALALLALVGFICVVPSFAQRMTPEQNARRSSKESKKQQKMLRKAAKKQRKATKKFAKAQRKQTNKANRDLQRRRAG
jgi:hypothetical protein